MTFRPRALNPACLFQGMCNTNVDGRQKAACTNKFSFWLPA